MEYFTVGELGTFAGLTVATSVIVQFTKPIIKKRFDDYFVRIYTFIVAAILSIIFIPHNNTAKEIVIILINSILIAIASMGGYETIKDPLAQKTFPNNKTNN